MNKYDEATLVARSWAEQLYAVYGDPISEMAKETLETLEEAAQLAKKQQKVLSLINKTIDKITTAQHVLVLDQLAKDIQKVLDK